MTETATATKIVSLKAANVKRLTAVHIQPNGNLVVIGGENGNGKTSVLDSIMYALAGKGSLPGKPLREGTQGGNVVLELDNGLKVTRFFAPDGSSTLKVEQNKGVKKSPQRILDDLVGPISFDPLEFSRMTPKAQLETLTGLLRLDFVELDEESAAKYEERTGVNREIKRMQGALASMPEHTDIDLSKPEPTIEEATQTMAAARDVAESLTSAATRLTYANNRLDQLKKEIAEAEQERDAAMKAMEGLGDMPDLEALEAEVSNVAKKREAYVEKRRRIDLLDALTEQEDAADELTDRISTLAKDRREAIAQADYPIDGLGIGGHGVELNGIPFEQLASSEQLKVSVAMGLAMNSKLKVLLIRDGSLLDDDSMEQVATMAAEADAQVWIERVGDGDEGAVIIEDGQVREAVEA